LGHLTFELKTIARRSSDEMDPPFGRARRLFRCGEQRRGWPVRLPPQEERLLLSSGTRLVLRPGEAELLPGSGSCLPCSGSELLPARADLLPGHVLPSQEEVLPVRPVRLLPSAQEQLLPA
jgi:hypothetical protein